MTQTKFTSRDLELFPLEDGKNSHLAQGAAVRIDGVNANGARLTLRYHGDVYSLTAENHALLDVHIVRTVQIADRLNDLAMKVEQDQAKNRAIPGNINGIRVTGHPSRDNHHSPRVW